MDEFRVLAYIWLCNAEYRQQQRVQRAYKGVHSTRLVRCRTSAGSLLNRLVMRIVRLYAENGNVFFSSAEI